MEKVVAGLMVVFVAAVVIAALKFVWHYFRHLR
jgi:hypothetical protein